MIFFKEYQLPEPPEQLINNILFNWIKKYNALHFIDQFPNLITTLVNKELNRRTVVSTIDPIKQLYNELDIWLCDNICHTDRYYSNWTLRMLTIESNTNELLYGPHLDTSYGDKTKEDNTCALIYNLNDSGGELVFYQEEGYPILREDRPILSQMHSNPKTMSQTSALHQRPQANRTFNKLNELYRTPTKHKTWYLVRANVVHGVENTYATSRHAIQLRLSNSEVAKFFPDFTS